MANNNLFEEIVINPTYSRLVLSEAMKKDFKTTEPKAEKKVFLTNDFVNRITDSLSSSNQVLPPNCRYTERVGRYTIVLIEEPPSFRTISLEHCDTSYYKENLRKKGVLEAYGYKNFNRSANAKFNLAFPYVIYLFIIQDGFNFVGGNVFFRTAQLSGLSDLLFKSPLTNINSDQEVCFGGGIRGSYQSLYATVQNTISVWWNAEFNDDYTANFSKYRKVPIINNYLEWEYMSKNDPMFIFSVDWIPYEKNIYKSIQELKSRYRISSDQGLTYQNMVSIFSRPSSSGISEKVSPRSKTTQTLYYDIAQTVYLTDEIILNVGDPVVLNDGKVGYIYSFVGFVNGGDIKYVQIECDGRFYTLKYNFAFKKFIADQIQKYRYKQEITLENGEVIKPNDIIEIDINGTKAYKHVDYIRICRRGGEKEQYEIKADGLFYFADKLNATVLNVKNPEIFGIKLSKDKKYLYLRRGTKNGAIIGISLVKYKKISLSSNNLYATFETLDKRVGTYEERCILSKTYTVPPIIDVDEVRPIDSIFRVGRKIYSITIGGEHKTGLAWSHRGNIYYENYYTLSPATFASIEQLIKDDVFSIDGPDFKTEFKVGDNVIVANWSNPIDVLNVKTLIGFKIDSSQKTLSFVLQSKDGTVSEEVYIDHKYSQIKTGYIRRVVTKFENLEVGTKIIAKKTGIACFPKKDVNIVVAIIADSPNEPLVLCSNGCTLWYSTIMKNFEQIPLKSKKWETMNHVPLDVNKIKFQSGDIINGRSDYNQHCGYIIFDPAPTRFLKCAMLDLYGTGQEFLTFDNYFMADAMFDCIPLPRISAAKQAKMETINGFYDFHGGVIENPESWLTFLK